MSPFIFLTLCLAFTMGLADHPPWGPESPPLMVKVTKCCAKNIFQSDVDIEKDKDTLKECFKMDMKPHTCDRDICIATKKGFASSDGTIDKKALQEKLEKDFEDGPLEAILENCVNGDISKFGNGDFCELKKMNMCIELHAIKSCDDWKENEDCKKLKTFIDSIIQKFE